LQKINSYSLLTNVNSDLNFSTQHYKQVTEITEVFGILRLSLAKTRGVYPIVKLSDQSCSTHLRMIFSKNNSCCFHSY